jgi:hypothetical protein
MTEYKGFKIGDIVKHRFRETIYQNCKIVKINESRLPLISVVECGVKSELPWMDLAHVNTSNN